MTMTPYVRDPATVDGRTLRAIVEEVAQMHCTFLWASETQQDKIMAQYHKGVVAGMRMIAGYIDRGTIPIEARERIAG